MNKIDKFRDKFSFLSNFFYHGKKETNEHFFQAMKCKNFEDMIRIIEAKDPKEAKKLGQTIEIRDDWEEIKDFIMILGLWMKFDDNQTLAVKLLNTGDIELVEGNYWHDNYWGSCTCENCKDKEKHNRLGKLLMIVRDVMLRLEYLSTN